MKNKNLVLSYCLTIQENRRMNERKKERKASTLSGFFPRKNDAKKGEKSEFAIILANI